MAAIICKTISAPFNIICTNICSNPFCLYVTTSTILNISPIVSSLISLANNNNNDNNADGKNCQEQNRIERWLYTNSFLCLMNIICAWYLSCKVLKSPQLSSSLSPSTNDPTPTTDSQIQMQTIRKRNNAFRHAIHILCYDAYMAIFIISSIFFFYWQWIGLIWLIQGRIHDNNNNNCDNDNNNYLHSYISSLVFGWCYIFIGSCSFCCSLFCSTFHDCEEITYYDDSHNTTTVIDGGRNDNNNNNNNSSNDMVAVSFTSRKDEPLLSSDHEQQNEELYSSIPIAEEVTAIPIVPFTNNNINSNTTTDGYNNNLQPRTTSESTILPAFVIPCPSINNKHNSG